VTQEKTTLAGWKKAASHPDVLLPSGVRVAIKLPDLPALVQTGEIPNNFLDLITQMAKRVEEKQQPTPEEMTKERELENIIISQTVVEPKLTVDDVGDLPVEDREWLIALAFRRRDLDAEGEHIAGLTKSEKFRRFRLLGEFDPSLADV
jgi:hypothetical protein